MSITIKYGRTNDFFFSGHMGLSTILLLEFWACKCYKSAMFTFFAMICNFFMLIVLRSHYSIDLVSGIIFGHYIWIMADRYSILWDPDWWFGWWKIFINGIINIINRSTWKDKTAKIIRENRPEE